MQDSQREESRRLKPRIWVSGHGVGLAGKSAAFKHDGVFIERTHKTRELDAVQEMNCDVLVALQGIVKERFLNVADRHDPNTAVSDGWPTPAAPPSGWETK